MSSRFFTNCDCDFFPCHKGLEKEEFNCLFCFCPLYALGKSCGGNFTYTNGIKDCSACVYPHVAENYEAICARFHEICALAKE